MPNQIPDMDSPHNVAAPGFSTNIAMTVTEHSFLPKPFKAFNDGECTDTETNEFRDLMDADPELYPDSRGTQYSLNACIVKRTHLEVAAVCNCTALAGLPYPPCSLDAMFMCVNDAFRNILDRAMSSDYLGCPRPCHDYVVKTVSSNNAFPSNNSVSSLQKQGVFPPNATDDDLKRDYQYLQLNFYFEDMVIYKTTQVPEFEWMNILGMLGGNMGFFLGASILTMTELLDFLVYLAMTVCSRIWCKVKVSNAPGKAVSSPAANLGGPGKNAW